MKKLFGILGAVLGLTLSCWPACAADIDDLMGKLKDKDADTRRQAAKALSDAGADAKPALPLLMKGLLDKDVYVRRFSAQALGNIGADAQTALPLMKAIIANSQETKEVQEAVVVALGKMGTSGVEILIAALRDGGKDTDVRRKAAESLGTLGTDAHAAVSALTDTLLGKDMAGKKKGPANPGDIRIEVVTALGGIANAKDSATIKALEDITTAKGNRNRALKSAASDALKKIKARNS
jgi:HEAT repeat protein